MLAGVQDRITDDMIHKYGCYALCLVRLSERELGVERSSEEAVNLIHEGMKAGFLETDCTVLDASGFMAYLTGARWTKKYGSSRELVPADWVIQEWYNPRTKLNHFRLAGWDPLENSITVKEGFIRSTRILRKVH
jgi:hypothetical protein